jgi:hypothetical protein
MEAKISKAQTEVWEWKEKAFHEIKSLDAKEQLKLVQEQTKNLLEKIKRKAQVTTK